MLDRRTRWTALAVVLLAAQVGCSRAPDSGNTTTPPAAASAILLRGSGAEPDSLDPQKARSVESQNILRDLCEGLTTLGKSAGVAPGVATDWTVSADGKKYTFNLRPEARWSNGERVVAADFVAALRRLADPATASTYAQVIDVVENASDIVAHKKPPESLGVHATGDATVVIDLAFPAAYLPSLLSHTSTCPVHRPTLTQRPAELAKPGSMVANGAFV